MRPWLFGAAVCFLVLAKASAGAQTSSSGTSNIPPKEISGKTLKEWIKDIRSSDPSVRQNAISTVAMFGKAAGEAGPAVIDALRDRDASCRVYAVLALGNLVPVLRNQDAPKAVSALCISLNKDVQAVVRFHSANALGTFGPNAREAIPALVTQLKDVASWEIRRAVIGALANIAIDTKYGPDSRAVKAIAGVLLGNPGPYGTGSYESSSQVRLQAVIALGSMGRPINPLDWKLVLDALQAASKDRDRGIVIWAHAAQMTLDKITEDGLSYIARNLKGGDVQAKVNAARALAALGSGAKSRVPELIECLEDSDPYVVATAIGALSDLEAATTRIGVLKTFD